MAMSEQYLAEPVESKRYLDEAMDLARRLNFENGIARVYNSLANYYWNLSEFPKALELGLLALRTYEKTNNTQGLYDIYNTLAGIHTGIGEFDKAVIYMNKIRELGNADAAIIDYGELYHNMGWLMLKLNRNQEGLDLINKSLDIFISQKNYFYVAQVYFLRAKAFQALQNFGDALADFFRCIQMNKAINPPSAHSSIAAAHEGIADIYIRQHKLTNASIHLDTAMSVARKIKSPNLVVKIYGHRVSLYELQRDFQKALAFERLRNNLRDSMFNSEKSQQLAEVQTKYETEKKEQAIQILERDQKIQELWRNILIVGLLLVILVSATMIVWLRYRERKNRKLFNLQIDFLTARHQELSLKYLDPMGRANAEFLEPQDQRFLKKVLETVEAHISDPQFGVEQMASELSMTRANLHRKLKSLASTTPSDFIRNIRLKRAASLLLGQVDSVSQIGFAVGFEDQSYFSKAFKKHFGVAPSEYSVEHQKSLI